MTAPITSGIHDVQARVAALQARLGIVPARSTSAAGGTDFASVLGAAEANGIGTVDLTDGAGSTPTGERVVALAKEQLGTPYVWGGDTPGGFDCSGFVQYVMNEAGVDVPRVSRDQARAGRPVAGLADARPGDLVFFGSPVDHVGIYAGDNEMVVAPRRGDVVKVQDVYTTPVAIRRVLPDQVVQGATSFDDLFAKAGARHGVRPELLEAVARAESGLNPSAISPAGAQGLMQLMPATARGLGVNPLDPAQAVDGAARLLSEHLQRYGGSTELALAAYNAGPGAVARHGGVPPYRETQNYIRRVVDLAGRS